MPALVLAEAVQVRLHWILNGITCFNVLGGKVGGGYVNSQAHTDSLAAAVADGFTASGLQALTATSCGLNGVGIRDIRVANQVEYINTSGGLIGTGTAHSLPNQLAAVVTLRTALAGKSYRGRVYIGGADEDQNTASARIDDDYNTACVDFIEAVKDAMDDEGITLAVLSRPRTSPPFDIAWGGAVTEVTSITTRDTVWDTQRRRRDQPAHYAGTAAAEDLIVPRGYVWRKYVADDASEWALQVDADHAADATRGWDSVASGTPYFPAGGRPRCVMGISATTGRAGSTRVGTVTCDLWTGAATTFDVEANDQTTDTLTVTQRRGEFMYMSRQNASSLTYQADVLALSPTIYWPMDDASGATALDESGNGYNATLNGGYIRGVPCPVGSVRGGTYFNGVDAYLQSGVRFTTHVLTVVAWLFVTQYDATQRWLLSIGNPNLVGPSPYWKVDQSGSLQSIGISKGDATTYQERKFARAPDSAWSMFAGVFDTSTAGTTQVLAYMQGNFTTLTTILSGNIGGGNWQSNDFYMMRQGATSAFYTQGILADVAIWSGTALTLPQLVALNRSGRGFGAGGATLSAQSDQQALLELILASVRKSY